MKKNIFLAAAMVLMTTLIFAQNQDNKPAPAPGARSEGHQRLSPAERAKEATDKLNALVTLTPDQYTKALEANTNFFSLQQAARGNGQSGEDMREKGKQLREQRDAKLKTILTADQWKKREEAQKAHQSQRGGPGGE